MEPAKIIVIDDNFSEYDPVLITLREKYGNDNVILKKKSSEGLKFVLDNLSQKLIVLLDLDLGPGEPHGVEVFEKIRQETSLVYVIIMTAKLINNIPHEALVKFINNDVLQFTSNTVDTSEFVRIVDSAIYKLEKRVDCILEQWIKRRPDEEVKKPFMTTSTGEIYTLEDIIVEIRKETQIGQRLEKGIIQLAIDLLTRDKEKLNG
jgi:DNA-binding NtrC family response regulator